MDFRVFQYILGRRYFFGWKISTAVLYLLLLVFEIEIKTFCCWSFWLMCHCNEKHLFLNKNLEYTLWLERLILFTLITSEQSLKKIKIISINFFQNANDVTYAQLNMHNVQNPDPISNSVESGTVYATISHIPPPPGLSRRDNDTPPAPPQFADDPRRLNSSVHPSNSSGEIGINKTSGDPHVRLHCQWNVRC